MSMMKRVSKASPCPVCQKTDWCLVGKSLVMCMRVQSNRPKTLADSSTGWLHPLKGDWVFKPPARKSERLRPTESITELMRIYQKQMTPYSLKVLANSLSVSEDSLDLLSVGKRDDHTWAFPMRNYNNEVVGIRLRTDTAKKFAEEGSRNALFIPQCKSEELVFLPEGPTNTAAALSIGLYAIGRPSNSAGAAEIACFIKKHHITRAVVIADTDNDKERDDGSSFNPGFDGAQSLQKQLPVWSCLIALPAKDVRKFVQSGGTGELVHALVSQAVWKKP